MNQMTPKAILFDLDGTLTDSAEGIINSVTLALTHFGLPVPDREYMKAFVGPPLRGILISHGVRPEDVEEAMTIFRSRYLTVGKYENKPYPGIREMLECLRSHGHKLYVATSKPEIQAVDILEHFDLARYFDLIAGAAMDKARDTKAAVIAYLLEQAGDMTQAVMVGDTAFDVTGAAAHGIPTIGVAWGYGKVAEMEAAGAAAIAKDPGELLALLEK